MPRAQHRRHWRPTTEPPPELVEKLAIEIETLRRFLSIRHGDQEPTLDEIEDAVLRLSGRLPEIVKLREQPDGMLMWTLLAAAVSVHPAPIGPRTRPGTTLIGPATAPDRGDLHSSCRSGDHLAFPHHLCAQQRAHEQTRSYATDCARGSA